jgi:nuclear transcription Y subunit beta
MSDSPPKNEQEAEQGAQSGEEPDQQMDREQEGVQQGLGDFEVKEQDRWLPIANGWFCFIFAPPLLVRFVICASLA